MGLYLTEKHIKYKKNGGGDYVSPFFIYHKNKKRTKVFCSLKIDQKDWNFKLKVHNDAVDLEKRAINAVRDIGVAFGKCIC